MCVPVRDRESERYLERERDRKKGEVEKRKRDTIEKRKEKENEMKGGNKNRKISLTCSLGIFCFHFVRIYVFFRESI